MKGRNKSIHSLVTLALTAGTTACGPHLNDQLKKMRGETSGGSSATPTQPAPTPNQTPSAAAAAPTPSPNQCPGFAGAPPTENWQPVQPSVLTATPPALGSIPSGEDLGTLNLFNFSAQSDFTPLATSAGLNFDVQWFASTPEDCSSKGTPTPACMNAAFLGGSCFLSTVPVSVKGAKGIDVRASYAAITVLPLTPSSDLGAIEALPMMTLNVSYTQNGSNYTQALTVLFGELSQQRIGTNPSDGSCEATAGTPALSNGNYFASTKDLVFTPAVPGADITNLTVSVCKDSLRTLNLQSVTAEIYN